MDRKQVIFGLHELEGIGWKTIQKIISAANGIEWGMESENSCLLSRSFLEQAGVRRDLIAKVQHGLTAEFVECRSAVYTREKVGISTYFDKDYPPLLKQIANPPWVLYYIGDLKKLSEPSIAIVGTRMPTAYGKHVAHQLGQDLASKGICIVSGMARGIDAASHRGALAAGGFTAAVLGSGVECAYPSENRTIYNRVKEQGIVLSEYPIGTPIHPGNFPRRNRIIAGLTYGTIVVEAAAKSGALITAGMALDANRECFIVPGPITSPKSKGVLDLWADGTVIPIRGAGDVLQGIKHWLSDESLLSSSRDAADDSTGKTGRDERSTGLDTLSEDERRILNFLVDGPATADEIEEVTKFAFGHLHSVLLSLLMKKKIEQKPGSYFQFITY